MAAQPPTAEASAPGPLTLTEVTIMAVQVEIAGPTTTQLAASDFAITQTSKASQVMIRLTNAGDTLLKPTGTFAIYTSQGTLVAQETLRMDTFLPQDTIAYPLPGSIPPLAPGTYTAQLRLWYGRDRLLEYTVQFTIGPDHTFLPGAQTTHQTRSPLAAEPDAADGALILVFLLLVAILLVLLRSLMQRRWRRFRGAHQRLPRGARAQERS